MSYRDVCLLAENLSRMLAVLQGDKMHEHTHDCALDEEIDAIIESDELHEPAAASACGPLAEADEVEAAIQGWISKLRDAGYTEEADNAVFDALAALVEANTLPDTPPSDSPPAIKQKWVFHFEKAIRDKLVEMGLEF